MKYVYNSIIPFKGFSMLTFYGLIFTRKEFKGKITPKAENEERIHAVQQVECAVFCEMLVTFSGIWLWHSLWWFIYPLIAWFLLYFLFWIFEVLLPPYDTAYRDVVFEREAKANSSNLNYMNSRPLFAWVKYFKKKR